MLKGFVTKSSAPASSASTLSASALRTVSMTMAISVLPRMARQAARLPMPGILRSKTTRSGRNLRIFSSASSPLLASSTSYPAPASVI